MPASIKQKLLFILFILFPYGLFGQDALMDIRTKNLLDSLDQRIYVLENELPRLAETRAPSWFFKKRDLDYTIFLRHYHRYLFDEDLDEAERLIQSRLTAAKKRGDNDAVSFYTEYHQRIAREIGNQQKRYQQLFEKEKNFKKEINRFLETGDEYSYQRAMRMIDLAIKYASEKNLSSVLEFLNEYDKFVEASYFNFHSEFELEKLTESEAFFFKTFNPLVESDSIELIKKAGDLVESCYNFALNTKTELDTSFFQMQHKVVNTSLSDYYDRIGNNASLASLGGQSVIAKLDSLNREGIYKWHDNIVVVGHFKPSSKFNDVKTGEAIIDADRRLIEYIRINRLANLNREVEMGYTYVIPYNSKGSNNSFLYNPEESKYQYMVCYTRVENQYLTKQISKFLPPLQFDIEMEEIQ